MEYGWLWLQRRFNHKPDRLREMAPKETVVPILNCAITKLTTIPYMNVVRLKRHCHRYSVKEQFPCKEEDVMWDLQFPGVFSRED